MSLGSSCLVRTFAATLAVLLVGCGPMIMPMSVRLPPEDQRQVDLSWDNMLTPVGRVDRQTLLDALVAFGMYQLGVDRLHMISEKYLAHGKAVMEIDCDAANPAADQFTVTVQDERGRTLRRERYSRAEVMDSLEIAWGSTQVWQFQTRELSAPCTRPATQAPTAPTETAEERRHRQEHERRLRAILAATQPATVHP